MVIGILTLELFLPESSSLKAKRMIIKSIKDKIHREFNVSIAEIGLNDLWQRAQLGVALVSNDQKFAGSVLNKIVDKISRYGALSIIDYNIEML